VVDEARHVAELERVDVPACQGGETYMSIVGLRQAVYVHPSKPTQTGSS
jgi:hypothetical protein